MTYKYIVIIEATEQLLGNAGHLRLLSAIPNRTDAVLLYHSVGEEQEFGNISMERFERDLQVLTEQYEIVDLDDSTTPSISESSVAITFDDALMNFYDNALPLLRQYDVPATVFVVAGTLTNEQTHLGTDRTMTEFQLRDLVADKRITLGNHSRSHPRLSSVETTTELRDEIVGAQEFLESSLGITVDIFAYPHGDYDKRVVDIVRKSHAMALTTFPKPWRSSQDRFKIPRITAHNLRRQMKWLAHDVGIK